jgi:hypothetical protein
MNLIKNIFLDETNKEFVPSEEFKKILEERDLTHDDSMFVVLEVYGCVINKLSPEELAIYHKWCDESRLHRLIVYNATVNTKIYLTQIDPNLINVQFILNALGFSFINILFLVVNNIDKTRKKFTKKEMQQKKCFVAHWLKKIKNDNKIRNINKTGDLEDYEYFLFALMDYVSRYEQSPNVLSSHDNDNNLCAI